MRACWLKWVGRDWSISADYIWLNYSGANSDTDLLIFDEPANGLDPLGIESIWALIGRLNREQGKTMLISSHDLDELASVATGCVFIHDGELLKMESMDVIRDEAPSLKEYYRRLMKAVSL